ncbi:MAG: DUF1476 domain-containing protein [Stellaceae bacterium]
MSGFDERERNFEKKFERDQELAFKAKARRNKLLAAWAAEQMGLRGSDAEAYARGIVEGELRHHNDDDLIAHLLRDAQAKGVTLDAARVRAELIRFHAEAKKQLGIPN